MHRINFGVEQALRVALVVASLTKLKSWIEKDAQHRRYQVANDAYYHKNSANATYGRVKPHCILVA